MRVAAALQPRHWETCGAQARALEEIGFDTVQCNEARSTPFTPLAFAALATGRIELATSVVVAFPRSPMLVAYDAWDLHRHAKGRFVLGLGSQVKAHNERRFSTPFTAPAARMGEYVQALRAIWRCWEFGERLDFRGSHYRFNLMIPEFSPGANHLPMIPITLAAVGPLMLKTAGRLCDGVRLHSFSTRAFIETVVQESLENGRQAGGRARENFEISGGGFVATGPDRAAVREAAERMRKRVALYASTPAYRPVLDVHGLGDLGQQLTRLSREGAFDRMAALVSDEVLALFAAIGTYEELPEAVERRFGGVVDMVTLDFPEDADRHAIRDVVEAIRRIPSRFTGFRTGWSTE